MTPNSTPRKRLTPEARRQHLLDCAVSVYAQLGVERAGHGDVAKLAGMSTPTVFNYFPTRKALTQAVLESVGTYVCQIFEGVEKQESLGEREKLARLAMSFNQLMDNNVDTAKVLLNWSVSFGPEVRPSYLEFQAQTIDRLSRVLNDRSPHKTDSRILYGASLTYATLKLDNTPEETLSEFITRIIDMVKPHA